MRMYMLMKEIIILFFLNQVHAGLRSVCAWFPEITFMQIRMYLYVRMSISKAINSCWRDLDFVFVSQFQFITLVPSI